VGGEAHKLSVLEQPAADRTLIVNDHRLHLIEEQFGRHATEEREGFFQAPHKHGHGLTRIKLQPQQPRVGQHDQ
jgi:hypothetical protein